MVDDNRPRNIIRWDAQRIYRRIKGDLPSWRGYAQEAISAIRLAAHDENEPLSTLDFSTYSKWNAREGIVGLIDGNIKALDFLYQAAYYQVADYRYMLALYLAHPTSMAVTSFNKIALALARAVSLGCWEEAEHLNQMLCIGLTTIRVRRDDRDPSFEDRYSFFYGTNVTCVAPFVLHLYSEFKSRPFPLNRLDVNPLAAMEAYEPLLQLWQTTDLEALKHAIQAACDLHLMRSKLTTKINNYEFESPEDMIHPVEILMLMRLRETVGLTTPAFDHPLLNTPVGRLYPVRNVPHDPDLDQALSNRLRWIDVIRPTLPTPWVRS